MPVLLVVLAYALGTFPTAALVGQRRGVDPTTSGSGNPGATNMYRTAGRRAGVLVLVGDAGKGAIAAGLGWAVGGHTLGMACACAAVAGHVVPVTRRFHGGKGVATALGAIVLLEPLVSVGLTVVFLLVVATSRVVSAASIVAAALLPVGTALAGRPAVEVALAAALGVAIIARHAENIGRIRRGTERRLEGRRTSTGRHELP